MSRNGETGFEAATLRQIAALKRERDRLAGELEAPDCKGRREKAARSAALTKQLKTFHRTLERFRATGATKL